MSVLYEFSRGLLTTGQISILCYCSATGLLRQLLIIESTGGFGRGEGTSCIILKPLDAAIQAGDPIRAIIRNTGSNQDGKTAGITMPNGGAQVALMRCVYESAGLDPLDTGFVEAHGTGTATGDPIEATALGEVFGRGQNQPPVVIGSIKSNIGHLEGASGVTSVIKSALMLERKFILPNFDFRTANKKIPFEKWNMKVSLPSGSNPSHTVLSSTIMLFSHLQLVRSTSGTFYLCRAFIMAEKMCSLQYWAGIFVERTKN